MKKVFGMIALVAAAVVLIAADATTTSQPLKIHQGTQTVRNQVILLGNNNACTTQFVSWAKQPYPSFGFNAWCKEEADTWTIDVTYRRTLWPTSDGPYVNDLDTVATGATVDAKVDTLRSAAVHYGYEFYPEVSQGGFFIIAVPESLTDTLWIDSVVFNGYGN